MSTAVQPKDSDEVSYADIARLSRFLRGTYGAQAMDEAQRRVNAYTRDTQYKLAELWTLVLMHLRGNPVTDETHRILKVRRRLTLKTVAEEISPSKHDSAAPKVLAKVREA